MNITNIVLMTFLFLAISILIITAFVRNETEKTEIKSKNLICDKDIQSLAEYILNECTIYPREEQIFELKKNNIFFNNFTKQYCLEVIE